MRFQAVLNRDGFWYWHMVGRNNKILSHSESYSRKVSCIRALRRVAKELGWAYNANALTVECPEF